MRIARSVASLSPVDVGDHVCWVAPPDDDFQRTARAYLQDGARIGDKLMVVGAASRHGGSSSPRRPFSSTPSPPPAARAGGQKDW